MNHEPTPIVITVPQRDNWWETQAAKKQLLEALNERFQFHKDGTIDPRDEKAQHN